MILATFLKFFTSVILDASYRHCQASCATTGSVAIRNKQHGTVQWITLCVVPRRLKRRCTGTLPGQGISAGVLRAATHSATRLGLYEPLQSFLTEQSGAEHPTFLVKIVGSVTSGAMGAVVGNPCELIKVRMQDGQSYQYRNVLHGFSSVVRDESNWYCDRCI